MKKVLISIIIVIMALSAGAMMAKQSNTCTKIQSGLLTDDDGSIITTETDFWGYNYQAHIFDGIYCDAYKNAEWCQPYPEDLLLMKWNNAYLSNTDCNGDRKLDRHFGFETYTGSGAWVTYHQSGTYEVDSKTCYWNYFVKYVAAPADAILTNGVWYTAEGIEIGPAVGDKPEFALIQDILNDPCGERVMYKNPYRNGLGNW
ncbi:MAG: hypothetical protein V1702_02045 [Candidatus Woesearchaeota archaeon]